MEVMRERRRIMGRGFLVFVRFQDIDYAPLRNTDVV